MEDIHLDPRLSLSSKTFVDSLMPELFRVMDLQRIRAAEEYVHILSCVLANQVNAGDRSVIVRMSKHVRYEGLSYRKLIRIIQAMEELGWIKFTKGEWRGDASTLDRGSLDLVGLEIVKEPKKILVVRKRGKEVNPDLYFSQEDLGRMKGEVREYNGFLETADITRGD